jgi:hypothetical protein
MEQAFNSRTIANTADPSTAHAEGPVEGVHWQLLSLATDAPPAQLMLQEAFSRSLLQSTMLPRSLLTALILGMACIHHTVITLIFTALNVGKARLTCPYCHVSEAM